MRVVTVDGDQNRLGGPHLGGPHLGGQGSSGWGLPGWLSSGWSKFMRMRTIWVVPSWDGPHPVWSILGGQKIRSHLFLSLTLFYAPTHFIPFTSALIPRGAFVVIRRLPSFRHARACAPGPEPRDRLWRRRSGKEHREGKHLRETQW